MHTRNINIESDWSPEAPNATKTTSHRNMQLLCGLIIPKCI